jgi:transcriptional regulator with XRE-family HTH domain
MKATDHDLRPNPDLVRKKVGSNIRAYRKEAKLSLMALAGRARIDVTTLHRIETAKTDTNISTLARIRGALNIPWNKFLEGV